MGVLEQVTELKNKGVPENRIVSSLREQGISPKDINDALSQSKIKSAVSANHSSDEMEPSIMPPINSNAGGEAITGGDLSNEDLTPPPSFTKIPSAAQRNFGRMTKEVSDNPEENEEYVPQPQEENSYYQQSYAPYQQEYTPQEAYEYQPSPQTASNLDSDTMIEIAEQVFSEKTKPLQKSIEDLTEISTLTQTKIENFSDRLKRLENTIDHLQSAILDKVGSYGSNLESIKKEMSMMQDSFSKIVNTAADNAEHKHHAHHAETLSHTPQKIEKTTTVVHKSSSKHTKKKTAKKKSSKKK